MTMPLCITAQNTALYCAFSVLTLLFGQQTGHPVVSKNNKA